MSIVPYNSENKIVYKDSKYGVAVLHDKEKNQLQLVANGISYFLDKDLVQINSELDSMFVERKGTTCCPNCGFTWIASPAEADRNIRSNDFKEFGKEETSDGRNEDFNNGSNSFMHNNYFKLLGNMSFYDEPQNFLNLDEHLPESVFNQGYFKKFFRKIPPYTLGSGARAQVYKVVHELNGVALGIYAIKRINIGDKLEFLEQVLNEVLILSDLSEKGSTGHNLIRYNHVWLEMGDIDDSNIIYLMDTSKSSSKDRRVPFMFILQQYCDGGHLEDLIVKNFVGPSNMEEFVHNERQRRRSLRKGYKSDSSVNKKPWLSDFEIWKFFKDIMTAVEFLHSHNIIHRDIKPSNCLLETEYDPTANLSEQFTDVDDLEEYCELLPRALLSDLGEGKFMNNASVGHKAGSIGPAERRGNTGTLEFTCPELWMFSSPEAYSSTERHYIHDFTPSNDIYSCGLLLCWLCLGSLPFSKMIQNDCDPESTRASITNWFNQLDKDGFNSWFMETLSENRNITEPSNVMNIFSNLSFAMIKGKPNDRCDSSLKLLSSDILLVLEDMKWQFFLKESHGSDVFGEFEEISTDENHRVVQDSDDPSEALNKHLELDLRKYTSPLDKGSRNYSGLPLTGRKIYTEIICNLVYIIGYYVCLIAIESRDFSFKVKIFNQFLILMFLGLQFSLKMESRNKIMLLITLVSVIFSQFVMHGDIPSSYYHVI